MGRLLDVEPRPIVIVLTWFANERLARALLKMGAGAYVSNACGGCPRVCAEVPRLRTTLKTGVI